MKKNMKNIEVFFDYEMLKKSEPCSKGAWAFRQVFGINKPFTGSKEEIKAITELRLSQTNLAGFPNTLHSVSADFTVTYSDYLLYTTDMRAGEERNVIFNSDSLERFVDSVYEWIQKLPITLLTERKDDAKFTAVA